MFICRYVKYTVNTYLIIFYDYNYYYYYYH